MLITPWLGRIETRAGCPPTTGRREGERGSGERGVGREWGERGEKGRGDLDQWQGGGTGAMRNGSEEPDQ